MNEEREKLAFQWYVKDQWDQGRDVEYMGPDAMSMKERIYYNLLVLMTL
jgi:hypothetical protein